MTAHCLFEQSGTFKNEFKKLGINAYDYDILNEYGETDYKIDLFSEIRGGMQEILQFLTKLNQQISFWLSFLASVLKIKSCWHLEGKLTEWKSGI